MPDLSHLGPLPDWAVVVLQILLILAVALVALHLARGFIHGIFMTVLDREAKEGAVRQLTPLELKKRMATLDSLGLSLVRFFIVTIAALMILDRLGLDIGPAITGLGIVGIAVGFGAQSLIKDYFNGALILMENQYGKGDVVKIAGVEGTVEDLSLRRTTLRDFDGNVHTVPNSAVVVASNLTRGWARIAEEVSLPSVDLVDQATAAVNRVGREMADDQAWHHRLLEPPHVERVDALGPSGATLRIGGRVEAADRWTALEDLRARLIVAFREAGIPMAPGTSSGLGTGGTAVAAPAGPATSGDETLDRTGPAPNQEDLAEGVAE
jgi:moderate conductance mechanosensitive channel